MFLKKGIKNITKKIAYHSRLTDFLLSRNSRKLLILCHHRIAPPGDRSTYLGVPQDIFEEQIVFLKRYFKIVSFKEGIESLKAKTIRKSLMVLNFDEGYRDNYLYAFPILRKYNITATIFLATGFIGGKERFWWDIVADTILRSPYLKAGTSEKIDMIEGIVDSLKRMSPKERNREIERIEKRFGTVENKSKGREMLNLEEIKEMRDYGIDFGSHTLTHPDLTLLGQDELIAEVLKSKQILEHALKKEIHSFAYPYGIYNEDVKKIVKKSNYSYARSMLNGFNTMSEDIFALKCISGYSHGLDDLVPRLSYRGL